MRTITITQVTNQDYYGVDETIKQATVTIDGKTINEFYPYALSKPDSEIETEINADLTAKGYPQ